MFNKQKMNAMNCTKCCVPLWLEQQFNLSKTVDSSKFPLTVKKIQGVQLKTFLRQVKEQNKKTFKV